MKFNVYAIKDVKKGTFLQPFFVPFYQREEEVKVDFARNLKAAESIISKFPEDFELWHLAEFYDEIGNFKCGSSDDDGNLYTCLIKVCSAAELLEENKEDVGNTEVN